MTIKEKTMIIIKSQKKSKPLNIIIIIVLILLAMFVIRKIENLNNNEQYTYTSYIQENSIVNGTIVGDVMMGRSVEQVANIYGYEYLFENVKQLWGNSDYVSCNLESAIFDSVDKYDSVDKDILAYSKMESLDALQNVGFNLLSIANNSVGNYGKEGISDTISALKERNIDYVGIGENIEEAKKYNIKEINGVKIATIAISDIILEDIDATDQECGVLTTSYADYPLIIADAKQNADIVIVNMHWGEEYTNDIIDNQEEIAKNLINAGADIIIGHHQHTLQSIEKYNDGIIFYGLGNFVFDQGWTFTRESALVNFSIDSEGNLAFEIIPILIENAQPNITTSLYHTTRIFSTLTERLDDSDYEIIDNRLIIKNLKVQIQTTEESSNDTSENTNQDDNEEITQDNNENVTNNSISENSTNNNNLN